MSPRAAWRLEALGFTDVYDYVAGKVEWLAYALPREGTATGVPTVGDVAQRDVPTARMDERLGVARERASAANWDTCVVINDDRVVLGRVGRSALAREADSVVSDVMAEGPTTIRPNKLVSAELDRMRHRSLSSVIVTTPDGRLHGLLLRTDAERLA